MNPQLAQDDDGFDLRSIHSRDSLDDLDSPTTKPQNKKDEEAALDLERGAFGGGSGLGGMGSVGAPDRGRSPAAGPSQSAGRTRPPRESLDGETIFAVGDDMEWSEGEPEEDGGEADKMVKRT
jgi:hypothetical protein